MNTGKPSPVPAPKRDETTEPIQEPVQNALWQWTELVKLEHRRIDSNDQRTQMLRHMITALIGGAGLVYLGQNLLQKWIGTSNGS